MVQVHSKDIGERSEAHFIALLVISQYLIKQSEPTSWEQASKVTSASTKRLQWLDENDTHLPTLGSLPRCYIVGRKGFSVHDEAQENEALGSGHPSTGDRLHTKKGLTSSDHPQFR